MATVIVVGGGLAGLSAAHTVLERGGRVLLLDKNAFLGGNSTKATSGINGALTRTQIEKGIPDSAAKFMEDTTASFYGGEDGVKGQPVPPIVEAMCSKSGPAVEWLMERFKLDLSLLGRLGGHSFPRTHRGKERFPGMTITYALMEKMEEICRVTPHLARTINKARVVRLIKSGDGAVTGVEYEKDGQKFVEHAGAVIIATGGYGSDFSDNSLLKRFRPDLMHLPTTNGDHCTGDGIKLSEDVGGGTIDMNMVQVHPTGMVHPDEPDAKVKFLAAEALRGVGGLLLDANGQRFCDELGRRDYVSGEMVKNKGPFRLVLNGLGSKEIEWHCKHYVSRSLMKHYTHADDLAKDMGIAPSVLAETFAKYNDVAARKADPFGKKFFQNLPFQVKDEFHVAVVTPVVHYCMGGLRISPETECLTPAGVPVPGLFAAGEVMGGVHGKNRLGGSSLLDCVVFGRVAGDTATRYLLGRLSSHPAADLSSSANGLVTRVNVDPATSRVTMEFSWGQAGAASSSAAATPAAATPAPAPATPAAPAAVPPPVAAKNKVYTLDEVAKHKTDKDCWVVVNGAVLDVTHFMKDHPGGARVIMMYAGKDASEEFNMLHKPDVVEKYAPECVIGQLARAKL